MLSMSLAIAIKVPEGLVLAAESRVSYRIPDGSGNNNFITFDNATKLLSFKEHDYVGAVTFGAGNIGMRTAHSFIPEFINQLGKERISIKSFAKKMSNFYMKQWEEAMPDEYDGQPMVFVVGGFDKTSPYASVYKFDLPSNPNPDLAIDDEAFNIVWGGDRTIVDRLFSGIDGRIDQAIESLLKSDELQTYREARDEIQLPISIPALALQDAVNFSITLIRTTIDLQSLSTGERTVGGPIDVVTITREDNLEYIQKKKIKGEKNMADGTHTIPSDKNAVATLPKIDWRYTSYMKDSTKDKRIKKSVKKTP